MEIEKSHRGKKKWELVRQVRAALWRKCGESAGRAAILFAGAASALRRRSGEGRAEPPDLADEGRVAEGGVEQERVDGGVV